MGQQSGLASIWRDFDGFNLNGVEQTDRSSQHSPEYPGCCQGKPFEWRQCCWVGQQNIGASRWSDHWLQLDLRSLYCLSNEQRHREIQILAIRSLSWFRHCSWSVLALLFLSTTSKLLNNELGHREMHLLIKTHLSLSHRSLWCDEDVAHLKWKRKRCFFCPECPQSANAHGTIKLSILIRFCPFPGLRPE